VDVSPGTIVVWSDLACPWAHVAVARLHRVRSELGLDDQVRFDHRAFSLELVNQEPTPYRVLSAEIPVTGALEPGAGWRMWQQPPWTWPVTTLLALEAVQAAKEQGLEVSERLDRALRRGFFAESRCISMRHVILDVARDTGVVDADALTAALDDGRCRRTVMEHRATAERDGVKGSPHLFLPDGSDEANPGIRQHWVGEHGEGVPVIDADDPAIYERLLRAAAG
jgi:predicted DsbA family dithiol-disulfide isomerase